VNIAELTLEVGKGEPADVDEGEMVVIGEGMVSGSRDVELNASERGIGGIVFVAALLEEVVSVVFVGIVVELGVIVEIVNVDVTASTVVVSFDWRGLIGMACATNKYGIKRTRRIGIMLNVL
jgi:hypothetical protein